KSLGAVVRTSNGRPPAARIASLTTFATPSRWLKQIASSDELLTTAIFGFSRSASLRPSAFHCARRTASRVVPGSKLLPSGFRGIVFPRPGAPRKAPPPPGPLLSYQATLGGACRRQPPRARMTKRIGTLVRRRESHAPRVVGADVCVLGAGISGVTAAIEAARLGRRVVLADAAPALGGQAVGSIIGTIIGLYTHGPNAYQITYGLASELIDELTARGALHRRSGRTGTITFQYDVIELGRWLEQKAHDAGVRALVGATLVDVDFADRRLRSATFATRFGPVRVEAAGFVDASGDAVL